MVKKEGEWIYYHDNGSISYIENTKVLSATPVTAWTVYLTNIYDTWKANNGIS